MNNAKPSFSPLNNPRFTDWLVWGLLLGLALVAYHFHELWSDEVQAWQIAKTAPWYELFFQIPHYEGHPPFWYLVLAFPARLGISWEWAVRGIGLLCMMGSGYLLIFKSPFARWIRYTLPFTYFFFYQYGIIVRPYSAMMLIMLLLAWLFPSRNEKPGRFICFLGALCACHLFGVAIAGGITAAWLWEIKGTRRVGVFIRDFLHDKRCYEMAALLGWALLLLGFTWPMAHSAAYAQYNASIGANAVYVLFGLPADAFLTNLYHGWFIREVAFGRGDLLQALYMGLLVWGLVLGFLPTDKRKYLLWPYVLLAGLMMGYCSRHHIGLFVLLVVWSMWIGLQTPGFTGPAWPRVLGQLAKWLLIISVLMNLAWTGVHLYFDVKLPSGPTAQAVQFLAGHHLLNKRIFAPWKIVRKQGKIAFMNVHAQALSPGLNLYTQRNIVANFHHGGQAAYSGNEDIHGDAAAAMAKWRLGGVPDVIIEGVDLDLIWPQAQLAAQYAPVYEIISYDLWKFDTPGKFAPAVLVRKDLLQPHHLQVIERHEDWIAAE